MSSSQLEATCPDEMANSDNKEEQPENEGNNEENQVNSNTFKSVYILYGVLAAIIGIIVYKLFPQRKYDIEKEFYNTLGSSIMNRQSFMEIKYSHDLIEHAMNEVKLKSKNSYVSHAGDTILKTHLEEYKPILKQSLKEQLRYDELPKDLNLKVDTAIKKAKYIKSGKDTYIQVDLSDAYGGTHYVGFGVVGFVEDENKNDTVMIGVSVYREEWTEQDHVRLKLQNWDKKDVERYIQYELYQRIYDKMDSNYRRRINSKDDFTRRIPTNFATGEKTANCQTVKTHIIFINDKSGSMSWDDNGKSKPEYGFIKDKGNLDNRLGCLYSGIQDFIQVRYEHECDDIISTVLFQSQGTIVTNRLPLTKTFVKDHLIKHGPGGGTNFGAGFNQANTLINYKENTIVIFLTDGESSDGGASDVVSKWKQNMKDKLTLYCVKIGSSSGDVMKKICDKGNGEMKNALNGLELIEVYQELVWKEFRKN